MAAEESSGALSGAASGAATGAMVAGPIGAVVGGIIGGIAGLFGGKKAKKARKYAEKAAKIERQQAQMQAGIQRRDMIRQARIARAQSVAAAASESGGLSSSAPMGAVSSLGSQLTSNLSYFDWQVGLGNEAQTYRSKAGKYARQAQAFQTGIQAVSSLAQFGAQSMAASKAANQAEIDTITGGWSSWSAKNPGF